MMHAKSSIKLAASLLVFLLILSAIGFVVGRALAGAPAQPAAQLSPLHPTFKLLDADGNSVQESGKPLSTMQTCGQCHDTQFIASHSFHTDLGSSQTYTPGTAPSGRPWDTSAGLYGKWDPLSYRYLSPSGDRRPDLDEQGWTAFFARRISGGGPAEASGVEMNCFLCHLEQPNNEARVAAIQNGEGQWAATATLLGSGVVWRTSSGGYRWNSSAFDENGEILARYVSIQDPTNENCAQCHGLVHTDPQQPLTLTGCSTEYWQTATTGQVIAGQKISLSGMNLANKADLNRSWDIHAERGLQCTDCHYSLNNPAHDQPSAESRPGHLEYDPRRLEIGEYLQKPDHNLARGQSAQFTVAPELKGAMRRCESCHNADTHKDWLPYTERHMQEVACETCHIPRLYAPAVQSYDWTVLQADGQPLSACRGVEGDSGTLSDLVTGFQPVLLQRSNIDGGKLLAPYNLIAVWYWVYDDVTGVRPVREADLRAAFFKGGSADGGYAPEVLQALDADGDGQLSQSELRIDKPEKQLVIANRLAALGLRNPRIQGEVQPYSINHDVTRGEGALRDCQTCHSNNSLLAAPIKLSDYLPGGAIPAFVQDANTAVSKDHLRMQGEALYYQPDTNDVGLYVFGHNRVGWIDAFGALFFVGVLLGVAGHGSLRFYKAMRQPRHTPELQRVYMYQVYERFWHWLQTFTIVILLFTGLVIHRPDVLGFLSFRHMVTVHNVAAAILVINAALSLFYHLASGEIQQFIPRPYGFFDQAIVQAKYYLKGIFRNEPHPFEKNPRKKMNPLQQATYFGILNVLLPLQIVTGALMWGVQRWPQIANLFGGLPFLAPFHSLIAWTFAAFIVGHVYLTTTGHEPLAGIKAMMIGWEEVEASAAKAQEERVPGELAGQGDEDLETGCRQPEPAPTD
jgi:thiosulfate reductase cytochrome b subunit